MKKLQSEQEFYRSLGHAMRRARRRTDLSPYYVGRMIDVHGMLYYEMERGRVAPTPYQVYRVIHLCCPELLKDWR